MTEHSTDGVDSDTQHTDISRRRMLQNTILVTTAGALAGCSETSEQDGTTTPDGSGDSDTDTTQNGDSQSSSPVVELDLVTVNRQVNPERFESMTQIAKQWGRLGIQINLRPLSTQEWISSMFGEEHQFKIGHMNWGGGPHRFDPVRYMATFTSGSGYNSSFYSNEEFDQAYQTLRTNFDRDARQQAAYKCQELLCRDLPGIMTRFAILKGGINTEKFGNWTAMPGEQPYRNVWNLTSLTPKTDDTTVFEPRVDAPDHLNPMALGGNVDNRFHRLVYDRLVRLGPDQAQPQPSSAETWDFVDNTTIDVTLREGLTFTDGKPVRPEDVKFTWDFFKEHGQPYLQTHFSSYDNSEVLDDRTIRFNLSQPDASILSYGFYLMPIMPQHVWEGITEEEDLEHPRQWTDPVYTANGPFKVVDDNMPERLILEVNEDYHMDFNGIEQYVVQQYGGHEQRMVELQKGNAAFITRVLTGQLKRIKANEGGSWDHVEPIEQKSIRWRSVQFNFNKEPSSDRALRRACAHATNQQAIIDIAYDGVGAYPAKSGNVISPINEFWHNPDTMTYEGGVEEARSVLEDAGYRWDDQGRLLYPEDMLPIEPPGPR